MGGGQGELGRARERQAMRQAETGGIWQSWGEPRRARESEAERGRARQGCAELGRARQGWAELGRARQS